MDNGKIFSKADKKEEGDSRLLAHISLWDRNRRRREVSS